MAGVTSEPVACGCHHSTQGFWPSPQGAHSLQQGEEQLLLDSHHHPSEADGAMSPWAMGWMKQALRGAEGASLALFHLPGRLANPTPHGLVHAGVIWPLREGICEQQVAGPALLTSSANNRALMWLKGGRREGGKHHLSARGQGTDGCGFLPLPSSPPFNLRLGRQPFPTPHKTL